MIDRHFLADVGLAVVLAFPTLALARPQVAIAPHHASVARLAETVAAEQTPVQRRYALPA
jgi:hypothetical protein